MKTYSKEKPEKIKYSVLTGTGKAHVCLRKNIQQETVEQHDAENGTTEYTQWVADEKQIFTTLSESDVEKQFDSLFLSADIPKPTIEERLSALEDAIMEAENNG